MGTVIRRECCKIRSLLSLFFCEAETINELSLIKVQMAWSSDMSDVRILQLLLLLLLLLLTWTLIVIVVLCLSLLHAIHSVNEIRNTALRGILFSLSFYPVLCFILCKICVGRGYIVKFVMCSSCRYCRVNDRILELEKQHEDVS